MIIIIFLILHFVLRFLCAMTQSLIGVKLHCTPCYSCFSKSSHGHIILKLCLVGTWTVNGMYANCMFISSDFLQWHHIHWMLFMLVLCLCGKRAGLQAISWTQRTQTWKKLCFHVMSQVKWNRPQSAYHVPTKCSLRLGTGEPHSYPVKANTVATSAEYHNNKSAIVNVLRVITILYIIGE